MLFCWIPALIKDHPLSIYAKCSEKPILHKLDIQQKWLGRLAVLYTLFINLTFILIIFMLNWQLFQNAIKCRQISLLTLIYLSTGDK